MQRHVQPMRPMRGRPTGFTISISRMCRLEIFHMTTLTAMLLSWWTD